MVPILVRASPVDKTFEEEEEAEEDIIENGEAHQQDRFIAFSLDEQKGFGNSRKKSYSDLTTLKSNLIYTYPFFAFIRQLSKTFLFSPLSFLAPIKRRTRRRSW